MILEEEVGDVVVEHMAKLASEKKSKEEKAAKEKETAAYREK